MSSARLTSKILAHHETCADPQMLASIASVVGSGRLDGGCAGGLSKRGDQVASVDRYMDCYAERCLLWGAEDKRAETISHQRETHVHPRDTQTPAKPVGEQGGLLCSVCDNLVHGRPLLCKQCGHGGHSKHMVVSSKDNHARHKVWFYRELCTCPQNVATGYFQRDSDWNKIVAWLLAQSGSCHREKSS